MDEDQSLTPKLGITVIKPEPPLGDRLCFRTMILGSSWSGRAWSTDPVHIHLTFLTYNFSDICGLVCRLLSQGFLVKVLFLLIIILLAKSFTTCCRRIGPNVTQYWCQPSISRTNSNSLSVSLSSYVLSLEKPTKQSMTFWNLCTPLLATRSTGIEISCRGITVVA